MWGKVNFTFQCRINCLNFLFWQGIIMGRILFHSRPFRRFEFFLRIPNNLEHEPWDVARLGCPVAAFKTVGLGARPCRRYDRWSPWLDIMDVARNHVC